MLQSQRMGVLKSIQYNVPHSGIYAGLSDILTFLIIVDMTCHARPISLLLIDTIFVHTNSMGSELL